MRLLPILLLLVLSAQPSWAAESPRLVLKDHRFVPERLEVPAGIKFQLIIKNESDKTIEWESDELDREEVVKAGEEATVFLGPLSPGEYPYFDDRHQESKGVLVAK